MVSSKPRPHFTSGKEPVPILQEAGWAPELVWTSIKSRTRRDSIPGRLARSSVPILTELPSSQISFNRLTPNDPYMGRTAPLTSKLCILYIYSTNIGTEYFKHAVYYPFLLFKMQFVS